MAVNPHLPEFWDTLTNNECNIDYCCSLYEHSHSRNPEQRAAFAVVVRAITDFVKSDTLNSHYKLWPHNIRNLHEWLFDKSDRDFSYSWWVRASCETQDQADYLSALFRSIIDKHIYSLQNPSE